MEYECMRVVDACVEIDVISFRGATGTGMRKIFVVKVGVNKTDANNDSKFDSFSLLTLAGVFFLDCNKLSFPKSSSFCFMYCCE